MLFIETGKILQFNIKIRRQPKTAESENIKRTLADILSCQLNMQVAQHYPATGQKQAGQEVSLMNIIADSFAKA